MLVSIRASKAKAETIIGQECLKQGKGKARQSAIERKNMKKLVLRSSILAIMLLFTGCATMFGGGGKQNINIQSSTPAKVKFSYKTNTIGMKFVKIPAGIFMMGKKGNCPKDDPFTSTDERQTCLRKYGDELPYHKVKVKSFYMAATEVTQMQYYKIMKKNPSLYVSGHWRMIRTDSRNYPVERVSWNDAKKFIKKLNQKENTNKYYLPTEQQWEYAARAGDTRDMPVDFYEYVWQHDGFDDSGAKTPRPVATKKPNNFGLYDMLGNAREWTNSCYTENYNKKCNIHLKTIRGGSWERDTRKPHYSGRSYDKPDQTSIWTLGFRIAKKK